MEISKVQRFYNKAAGDAFCYDDCICSFANHCGIEYRSIYLKSLRTIFNVENGKLKANEVDLYNELDVLCGIQMHDLAKDNKIQLEDIVRELKNDQIILVDMLGNCCPWDWRYGETDLEGSHSFFFVGVDEENEEIICDDPYYEVQEERLPYECCENGLSAAKVYTYKDMEKLSSQDIREMIVKEKTYWDENYTVLFEFAEHLKEHIDNSLADNPINSEDADTFEVISGNEIYQIMEEISNNIIRFVWFLQFIKEQGIITSDEIINDLVNTSNMWNTIKKVFVKQLYRGKLNIEILQEKVKEAILFEKEILERLVRVVRQEEDEVENKKVLCDVQETVNYVPVNVGQFFNNTGVNNKTNVSADLSGLGEWIVAESMPADNKVDYKEIPFQLDFKSNTFDNIVCRKQIIEVKKDNCFRISFIACSDWEECEDIFQIRYKDRSVQNELLEIMKWVPERRQKLDNICLTVKKNIKVLSDRYENCNLYYYEINCDSEKEIEAIVLPNNDNIHIFAMTLTTLS